jgi:heme-degrading monooxygenase HmoA
MITVGMNYEVLADKNEPFEKKFALVVEAMGSMPDHVRTHLYQDVANRSSYLVVSEWRNRAGFDAFVGSDAFRKVANWGASGILATRPRHEVYGADDTRPVASGCPAHASA